MSMGANIGRESLAKELLALMDRIEQVADHQEQLEYIREFAEENLDCSGD